MDTSRPFLCTVMHPRLLPAPPMTSGGPLRVKLLVEIAPQELIIRASAPSAKGKIIGTEPWPKIERVTVEPLQGSAQRLEILRRSLWRMALVGGGLLVFGLVVRAYPIEISLLMALIVGGFTGALNFLLNGGFGSKQDVVRIHFTLAERGQPFYLEVSTEQEWDVRQALRGVGLHLEDSESNQSAL